MEPGRDASGVRRYRSPSAKSADIGRDGSYSPGRILTARSAVRLPPPDPTTRSHADKGSLRPGTGGGEVLVRLA